MKTTIKTLSVILGVLFLLGCASTKCKKCNTAASVSETQAYVAPAAQTVVKPAAVAATPAPVAEEEPAAEKVPVYVRK